MTRKVIEAFGGDAHAAPPRSDESAGPAQAGCANPSPAPSRDREALIEELTATSAALERSSNTLYQSHYYWLRAAKEALQGDPGRLRKHVAISEGLTRETVLDGMAQALSLRPSNTLRGALEVAAGRLHWCATANPGCQTHDGRKLALDWSEEARAVLTSAPNSLSLDREAVLEAMARAIVEEKGEAADTPVSRWYGVTDHGGEWRQVGPLWKIEGLPIATVALEAHERLLTLIGGEA